jgi:pimeloyl-ACP methyl ester carboxylesterase
MHASHSLYMQDFGGPVGFRVAARRPERVRALIIQNANACDEGVSSGVRDVVLRIWKERTPETEARLKELFELSATKRQYLEGSPNARESGRLAARTMGYGSLRKQVDPVYPSCELWK